MKSYLLMWKNIFRFKGNTTREEFWPAFGIHILILIVLVNVTRKTGGTTEAVVGLCIYVFPAFVAFLGLISRRLQDADLSTSYMCLLVVPFGIFVLLFLCTKETVSCHYDPYLHDEEESLSALGYGKKKE